jgi:glyoxylate reductase
MLEDCSTDTSTNSANDSWKSLSSLAELIEPRARCRIDFIAECRSGAFDHVLAIYRTFESVETTGRFDEEVVDALPASVRFICHNGKKWSLIIS